MDITQNLNGPAIFSGAYRQRLAELYNVEQLTWWYRCHLKILIVADNFLFFDDSDFGLSAFVQSLKDRSTSSHPMTVDLAHRGNPSASRLNGATPNFTFDYDDLKKYHQVWIFAADYPSRDVSQGRAPAAPIGDDERQAIRRYMDEGGGVFATGDHEDLGVTVGGYIPRVRSMRRWFFGEPDPAPQGEARAPDGGNASRHDTNREGLDAGWEFNDQSDVIPQPIIPKTYIRISSGGMLRVPVRVPHPILCGSKGTIKVLPDHPHEGECEVPADINTNYSIGADTFEEYPTDADGNRVSPEVIADATILAGAQTSTKPPTPAGRFGVIGAYDGHRAGVGRIVVDATWHHFININLVGDRKLGAPDPAIPKSMGFLHTPAGQAAYAKIKEYFYNISRWLSPNVFRRCVFQRVVWETVNNPAFMQQTNLRDRLVTGGALLDGLRVRLGKCESLAFVLEEVYENFRLDWRVIRDMDPFGPRGPQPDPAPFATDADQSMLIILGAIAEQMLAIKVDEPHELVRRTADKQGRVPKLEKAMSEGIKRGLHYVRDALEQEAKAKLSLVKQFDKLSSSHKAA